MILKRGPPTQKHSKEETSTRKVYMNYSNINKSATTARYYNCSHLINLVKRIESLEVAQAFNVVVSFPEERSI